MILTEKFNKFRMRWSKQTHGTKFKNRYSKHLAQQILQSRVYLQVMMS